MKISKRQLKRIIREEYSKLKRRGLIRESFQSRHAGTAPAEFGAICLDMGMNMGQQDRMSKLYEKVHFCWLNKKHPMECAEMLEPQEQAMLVDDFQNVLVACESPECEHILHYAMDCEEYCGDGYY